LSGAVLAVAQLRNVRFRSCRMDTVNLRMITAQRVRFDECDLTGADLYEAQLPEAQLLGCRLAGADVSKASLPGAELHGSQLDGIVGVLALRDVVIDALQVMTLAPALIAAHGITVTDEST
jgi:uncharacterized protein YjbI with pentapeptide repeats